MTAPQLLIIDNTKLKEKVILLQKKNDFLREKFKLAQSRQFGTSSERSPDQADWLINEVEVKVDEISAENNAMITTGATGIEIESAATSTKKKTDPKPLPKNLPREIRIIDVSDAEKICPCCSGQLHKMGEEKNEQLEYIPVSLKVIEPQRPKYACRHCENNNTRTPIIIAQPPISPIPKSIATPSLLAYIISNKYQLALPLYRQETVFKQLNIELNRKTTANWMIRIADVLERLLQRLKITLLTQTAIHADETPVVVIADDNQKSYMWVYCSGRYSADPNSPAKT